MLIVTGLFPQSPYAYGSAFKRNHPSHSTPEVTGTDAIESFMLHDLERAIAASSQMFIPDSSRPPGHFGPFWCQVQGEPDIKPPDRFFNFKVKNSNPHFQERSRKGEIITSSYHIGSNHLSYSLGFVKESAIPWGTETYTLSSDGIALGKELEMDPSTGWDWWRSGNLDYNSMSCRAPLMRETRSYNVSPYSVGWDDLPFSFEDGNISVPDVLSNIVTEMLADANRSTVDFLTALAEAPETLKDILSAAIFIKKKFFSAQRDTFRFLNLVKSGDKYAMRLAAKNIKETGDAASHIWLTFRYGIMPNVYLIEDILKAIDNGERAYARWRKTVTRMLDLDRYVPPAPPGWVRSGSLESVDRAFIKRAFKQASIMNEFSSIPLTTAWELVPLSFVIDWFFNVGDICASLAGSSSSIAQEGATYSWQLKGNYIYTHMASNAMVSIEHKSYHRIVISPSDYCQFSWQPQLNASRVLDALALTWRAIT